MFANLKLTEMLNDNHDGEFRSDSRRFPDLFAKLRLQPFSFRLPLEREINGNSWLNSLTNYIRLIYSIYTV